MDYWCPNRLIITLEGPSGRFEQELDQPYACVGSHPLSDVIIPEADAPRRCLYVHLTNDGIYCADLERGQSTFHPHGVWLNADEALSIGEYTLRARSSVPVRGGKKPAVDLITWGSAPVPWPVFNVFFDKRAIDKRRFRARLNLLGRKPQCALQLKGQLVSNYHSVLYWDAGKLWCIDLNSSNGTQVNGRTIRCSKLELNDKVQVGEFSLVYTRLSSGSGRHGRWRENPPAGTSSNGREALIAGADATSETDNSTERDTAGPFQPVRLPPAAGNGTAKPGATKPTDIPKPPVRDELAEELARLAEERRALQGQWETTSALLVSQIKQLQDEAARLAEQRESLDGARQQWDAERTELKSQLLDRSARLAQIEASLAASSTAGPPQAEPIVALTATDTSAELIEQESGVTSAEPAIARASTPVEQGEPSKPAASDEHQPDEACKSPVEQFFSEPEPSMVPAVQQVSTEDSQTPWQPFSFTGSDRSAASEAPTFTLSIPPTLTSPRSDPTPPTVLTSRASDEDLVIEGTVSSSAPAGSVGSAAVVPTGRRKPAPRDELTNFVSDKLVHMDQVRRRRQLLIWSAAVVTGGALVGIVAWTCTLIW